MAGIRTLNELFLGTVERFRKPEMFLIKGPDGYRGVSAEEVLNKVAALALALRQRGVKRGDRVALLSENRLEWPLTDYALLALGVVSVPIYPTLLDPDVEFVLRDSGCVGLILSTEAQRKKLSRIRSRLPELRFVLGLDCAHGEVTGIENWATVLQAALQSPEFSVETFRAQALAVTPEELATIIYTSGTTAESKGVMLTHANIVANVLGCEQLFPIGPTDVVLSVLPLCHIFERTVDYVTTRLGASIAFPESFEALPRNLLEVQPTIMAVVPRVLEKIQDKALETVRHLPSPIRRFFEWSLKIGRQRFPMMLAGQRVPWLLRAKHCLADAAALSRVRGRLGGRVRFMISGSAPLSPELADFFFAVGVPVYEGYGLTETSPVVAVNYPGAIKLGTVGTPLPNVEVRLGETFSDEDGVVGREILVRGPSVFSGYYHAEEATQQAFLEGWFRTGDLGDLDAEGYLRVTGRKKNLFKTSGGKYVSPEKIENLFQGHRYISHIVVLGDRREYVSALVVPNFPHLEEYARDQGLTWSSYEELVTIPHIQVFLQKQVEESTRWLPRYEKVRQTAVLSKPFTIETGELSATLKVKRRVVESRYADLIEGTYRRS